MASKYLRDPYWVNCTKSGEIALGASLPFVLELPFNESKRYSKCHLLKFMTQGVAISYISC